MSLPVPAPTAPATKTRKRRTALPCRGREQALAEGHLVDVSDAGCKAGFRWPIAITKAAFEDCVAWSEPDTARQVFQNPQVRLQSMLFMARAAGTGPHQNGSAGGLTFDLLRIPRDGRSRHAKRIHLRLIAGRDGQGEPVLTILLPIES